MCIRDRYLAVMKSLADTWPEVPQVALFETYFHRTIPEPRRDVYKRQLLSLVSILVLNEHELDLLAGAGDEEAQLQRLLDLGIKHVVLTKGGDGVVYMSDSGLPVSYTHLDVYKRQDHLGSFVVGRVIVGRINRFNLAVLHENMRTPCGRMDEYILKNCMCHVFTVKAYNAVNRNVRSG